MVEIDARLDIHPELKTSADGFPCRSASSASARHRIVGAGTVAGSARPCPISANRLDRGLDDVGMAAHAETVVRAPDRHSRALGPPRPRDAIDDWARVRRARESRSVGPPFASRRGTASLNFCSESIVSLTKGDLAPPLTPRSH